MIDIVEHDFRLESISMNPCIYLLALPDNQYRFIRHVLKYPEYRDIKDHRGVFFIKKRTDGYRNMITQEYFNIPNEKDKALFLLKWS